MNRSKRGPEVAAPKHINDFTKALAAEMRILLQEVGELRDERRQLQYEVAELMALKSKHGAGGEFTQDWMPKQRAQEPLGIGAPPPMPAADNAPPAEPAPPAWRTIVKHEPRKKKAKNPPQAITAGPTPVVAPSPQLPAWAQWKPNPLLNPTPRGAPPAAVPPSAPSPRDDGLFGPKTPPPK